MGEVPNANTSCSWSTTPLGRNLLNIDVHTGGFFVGHHLQNKSNSISKFDHSCDTAANAEHSPEVICYEFAQNAATSCLCLIAVIIERNCQIRVDIDSRLNSRLRYFL
jgi:hypothetical protein